MEPLAERKAGLQILKQMKEQNRKKEEINYDYRSILFALDNKVLAIILLEDTIKVNAKETLDYFLKENVDIKIISGDDPKTVSNVIKRCGIDFYDNYIDVSNLSLEEVRKSASKYSIFGRVKPKQKRELIKALKDKGHTVSMIGDGVNDALSLKEADLSITFSNASDAAKNISNLVLMDNNYSYLPNVLLEGRRVINNIGRSATFFLTKTILTFLLVMCLLFLNFNYPYAPIHLSMMNLITIGAPSLVLALEPNKDKVEGNFLINILKKCFPLAISIFISIMIGISVSGYIGYNSYEVSTICVFINTLVMFIYLISLCYPFNFMRRVLCISMMLIFSVEVIFFQSFFNLSSLNIDIGTIIIILTALGVLLYVLLRKGFNKFYKLITR